MNIEEDDCKNEYVIHKNEDFDYEWLSPEFVDSKNINKYIEYDRDWLYETKKNKLQKNTKDQMDDNESVTSTKSTSTYLTEESYLSE